MRKRLSNVAPLQLGIVLGALYGCLGLIFVPFFLLFSMIAPHLQNAGGSSSAAGPAAAFMAMGVGMAIMIPIFYAILGFIGGVISALIYNLIAMMTGGVEFTVTDMV
jgi:hypothetical protein